MKAFAFIFDIKETEICLLALSVVLWHKLLWCFWAQSKL